MNCLTDQENLRWVFIQPKDPIVVLLHANPKSKDEILIRASQGSHVFSWSLKKFAFSSLLLDYRFHESLFLIVPKDQINLEKYPLFPRNKKPRSIISQTPGQILKLAFIAYMVLCCKKRFLIWAPK